MATPASGTCPSATTVAASDAETIQLENVVRRAHQRPFTLDLLKSAQEKLPKATRLLDLSDHRFDDGFPPGIDGSAHLAVQLAGHPVDDRRGLRQGPARTGPGAFAMFLLPCRDVRVDGRVRDGRQVRVRAIAGV